jgi:hypothetical protein
MIEDDASVVANLGDLSKEDGLKVTLFYSGDQRLDSRRNDWHQSACNFSFAVGSVKV